MTKISNQIDNFIKDNGDHPMDALNVALFTIETLRMDIELLKLKIKRIESQQKPNKEDF